MLVACQLTSCWLVQVEEFYLSDPESIEFPTEGGLTAYMNYYRPRNDHFRCVVLRLVDNRQYAAHMIHAHLEQPANPNPQAALGRSPSRVREGASPDC